MKRPLAALCRLSTIATILATVGLVIGCMTNDPAESAKIQDLAFWCHDHLGITEVHSPAMNDCIRQNWNRNTMETTTIIKEPARHG